MEINKKSYISKPVEAIVFDFDGTISTLRSGWEEVMKNFMLEMMSEVNICNALLEKEIIDYINDSTGIHTIHQMKWLLEKIKDSDKHHLMPEDPWWYKAEYNKRIKNKIKHRIEDLHSKRVSRDHYMINGCEELLTTLSHYGIKLYVASGTDHSEVLNDIAALNISHFFTKVAGSPEKSENCSKEQIINDLIINEGVDCSNLAVIGDGKVEISLGKKVGARTIGIASNEDKSGGVNHMKLNRLINAGADIIMPDYTDISTVIDFLGY